jgi:hypothetical protein
LSKLKEDSLAVLDYFTSGYFNNTDATGRTNYYSISSVPTAKFDGRRTVVGGGSGTFASYLSNYNYELQFNPDTSCLLSIFVDYNDTTRFLKVKARVTAVAPFLSPHLRYAIVENNVPYSWGGGGAPVVNPTSHIVRKMLPNYAGVSFNITPGQTFVDSQTYTLPSPAGTPPSCCNDDNSYVVVFVQRDDLTTKDVLRSAKSGLFPTWVYGDASDDSLVDVSDLIYLMNFLFVNGPPPSPLASGDTNYDCVIDISDVVYLMNYLFANGPAPLKGCAW